ncbi:AI-2E family transporter [Kitasatospora sp. NPDC094015]|uniref:AI-2E family transporter n=1 Tax=Kitasatospora sp. NPDC094015 TaxID=3155205 RepID=UPI00331E418F
MSDYAWRLLVIAGAGYLILMIVGRFHLVTLSFFLALVITSVLRPLVDLFARRMPRSLAVLLALVGAVVLIAALLALVGETVAVETTTLSEEFQSGVDRLKHFLTGPPFHVDRSVFDDLGKKVTTYLAEHRSTLISSAVSGASRAVEVATGAALALFTTVFLLHSGDRMWLWTRGQLPPGARDPYHRAGRTAWRTFAGYTRGIVIVAGTNAVLVGIALFLLGVPLALPLTLLEFFASFIPLVGSPIAMAVASLVAFASQGPVIALVVLALIVVIGQIEGHLLHPLVMSWAVNLHPVVVAASVLCGSIAAGVIGAVVAVPAVSVVWAVTTELRHGDGAAGAGGGRRTDGPGEGAPLGG